MTQADKRNGGSVAFYLTGGGVEGDFLLSGQLEEVGEFGGNQTKTGTSI